MSSRARIAVALLAAVVLAPAAAGHPRAKGYARGFHSKVVAVRPEVPGLDVRVVGGDDRLRLENRSATEVVVLGYDGEPYLRIGRNAAFHNLRSPASYLNRDRFARVSVPLRADPGARPCGGRSARTRCGSGTTTGSSGWLSARRPLSGTGPTSGMRSSTGACPPGSALAP